MSRLVGDCVRLELAIVRATGKERDVGWRLKSGDERWHRHVRGAYDAWRWLTTKIISTTTLPASASCNIQTRCLSNSQLQSIMPSPYSPPPTALNPLTAPDGSATHSAHGYTVTAAVNGPLEVSRRDELPEEAALEVNVRPAVGVGSTLPFLFGRSDWTLADIGSSASRSTPGSHSRARAEADSAGEDVPAHVNPDHAADSAHAGAAARRDFCTFGRLPYMEI
jgi:hypothetical protein